MADTHTSRTPAAESGIGSGLDSLWQVVLHNDDHNSMEYVVLCLMAVFGHPLQLAAKIMFEAHKRGSAVAEVEAEESARAHQQQLQSHSLIATVEKI